MKEGHCKEKESKNFTKNSNVDSPQTLTNLKMD